MEDLSRIDKLSKEELIDRVRWSQDITNRCIVELDKRHEAEVENLRSKLSKIGQITSDGSSPSKSSVKERSINCPNTSTVVSTMSESEKTVAYHKDDTDDCSCDSHDSSRSGSRIFVPRPVGNDCDGNFLYPNDIVEILSPSKNGTPFRIKDKGRVLKSPGRKKGKQICVRSLENVSLKGYRSGKNLRLKQSHYNA